MDAIHTRLERLHSGHARFSSTKRADAAVLAAAGLVMLMGCSGSGGEDFGAWDERGTLAALAVSCSMTTLPDGDTVRVTLKNGGDQPVRLLRWDTPFDDKSDAMRVESSAGEAARFTGLRAIRVDGMWGDNAFVTVAPGEKASTEYAAGALYSLEAGATYSIAPRYASFRVAVGDDELETVLHDCGQAQLNPTRSSDARTIQQPLHAHADCTAAQQEIIDRDNDTAYMAAGISYALLSDNSVYREWFGAYSADNANSARQYIARYRSKDWEARCGGGCCDTEPLGCVDGHDRLYLCDKWWGLPPTSVETRSRVGLMIHEHTHLDVNFDGTSDVRHDVCDEPLDPNDPLTPFAEFLGLANDKCYGATKARALAETCGPGAVPFIWAPGLETCWPLLNAQNYEQFVTDALAQTLYVAAVY